MTPYQQLWNVVDGAVSDAFKNHPDYLTKKGQRSARTSINKRVVGTVLGFAVQARGRARPADNEDGDLSSSPQASAPYHVDVAGEVVASPAPHCRIGKWKPKTRSRYRSASMFPVTTARLMNELRGRA